MSKFYVRNPANTGWDEVKKGFKARNGSSWIEPKVINYRNGSVWAEHKFETIRVMELGHGYDASENKETDIVREVGFDDFTVINTYRLPDDTFLYDAGTFENIRNYWLIGKNGSYNPKYLEEVNLDTFTAIQSFTADRYYNAISGSDEYMYAVRYYSSTNCNIKWLNPIDMTVIVQSSRLSNALGRMDERMFSFNRSTYKVEELNMEGLAKINSYAYAKEITSLSGVNGQLFIFDKYNVTGGTGHSRREINPDTGAVLWSKETYNRPKSITDLYGIGLAITKG